MGVLDGDGEFGAQGNPILDVEVGPRDAVVVLDRAEELHPLGAVAALGDPLDPVLATVGKQ